MMRKPRSKHHWMNKCVCWVLLALSVPAYAVDGLTITPDVVYGHKHGMALTLDVYQPEQANGVGVLFMVSGGWHSQWAPPEKILGLFKHLVEAKFTVFAVRHGSSPKYVVPEIVKDVQRSVRFLRVHAADYGVDPDRLGVCGMSAGGHLSLILGTRGDDGDPNGRDVYAQAGSRVAAVVAYCPPTDLRPLVQADSPYRQNFPSLRFDPNEAPAVSPLLQAGPDAPPTLLVHGDQDVLVPIWHSEKMARALQSAGAVSELMVIKGGGHGFQGEDAKRAREAWVGWFEKYLLKE